MSARLPRGVSRDQTIKALECKGWRVLAPKGSHDAMEQPDFEPTIVVPDKELPVGHAQQDPQDGRAQSR